MLKNMKEKISGQGLDNSMLAEHKTQLLKRIFTLKYEKDELLKIQFNVIINDIFGHPNAHQIVMDEVLAKEFLKSLLNDKLFTEDPKTTTKASIMIGYLLKFIKADISEINAELRNLENPV